MSGKLTKQFKERMLRAFNDYIKIVHKENKPEWMKYIVVDKDGTGWIYNHNPVLPNNSECWNCDNRIPFAYTNFEKFTPDIEPLIFDSTSWKNAIINLEEIDNTNTEKTDISFKNIRKDIEYLSKTIKDVQDILNGILSKI